MATGRPRGPKRSSWATYRRRLALIRQLLQGPASGKALIETLSQELGDETYPSASRYALRHDMTALRNEFGCVIVCRSGRYSIEDLGSLHLLNLSDAGLEALQTLQSLIANLPPLFQKELDQLLKQLILLLPPERNRHVKAGSSTIRLISARSTADPAPRQLIAKLRRVLKRQQIEFDYLSRYSTKGPTKHRAAPYELLIEDGHIYLDADSLWAEGTDFVQKRQAYRIDRIIPETLRVLPEVVPHQRLPQRRYRLRYTLSPEVSRRRDIAIYFDQASVSYHEDGAATVTVEITDLWQAHKILLRYGGLCQIHEPEELIDLFRSTAKRLVEIYLGDTEPS